jgi:hypothetical protein
MSLAVDLSIASLKWFVIDFSVEGLTCGAIVVGARF